MKFPRSRLSNSSSSSGGSRKESNNSRQSSEDVAQELFHNIEQFTKQAKKAAESIEVAVEASRSKVMTGVTKEALAEDIDSVRKVVVDDIKTAMERKSELLKSMSGEGEGREVEGEVEQQSAPASLQPGTADAGEGEPGLAGQLAQHTHGFLGGLLGSYCAAHTESPDNCADTDLNFTVERRRDSLESEPAGRGKLWCCTLWPVKLNNSGLVFA